MDDRNDTIKEEEKDDIHEPEIVEEEENDVLDEAHEKSNEWEEKYKRALADYQNLEKRVSEQRREWIISASREVLNRLLPVLDTLILAGKHVEDKGLQMSIQQFTDVLKAEGVVTIDTSGKKFDPAMMEAVGTGIGDEGKVIEETRAGYLLNDKLLRPAQVIVGAKKEKN